MSQDFDKLRDVVSHLRGPNGCPWDRKQTHETLKPHLIEEAYEVVDIIDHQDPRLLREELGDLLLQILLHSQIEEEQGTFTIENVLADLSQKLIRRHPHVFNQSEVAAHVLTPDQVASQWETIKKAERAEKGKPDSVLDGIPPTLPSLLRAYQIQSRASRVGFDWEKPQQVVEKLNEELEELREAVAFQEKHCSSNPDKSYDAVGHDSIEQEVGDVLFTVANLARFLRVNPEVALRKATNRFIQRFRFMESQAVQHQKMLEDLTASEWDTWWEEAKRQEQLPTGKKEV